ncbi:hypothetical protein [Planotetraspora phitsanulokensis]|nr:hypothetical protein [Planotetraspora phitsanulokensis]
MTAQTGVSWRPFDYEDKAATAPPTDRMVWIWETFEEGVDLGYFDGFTMRTAAGSDDCHVTHWAFMDVPPGPQS